VVLSLLLSGCSASWSFNPAGGFGAPAPAPAPARVIVEPTGQVITTPLEPIEVTIEGLSQAQTVRSLVKQLSRNQ
jgi:hypothetical protein